jgi:hypothetical protein
VLDVQCDYETLKRISDNLRKIDKDEMPCPYRHFVLINGRLPQPSTGKQVTTYEQMSKV